ncbi:unnamed protein product, partial [marine sediment metagenome]
GRVAMPEVKSIREIAKALKDKLDMEQYPSKQPEEFTFTLVLVPNAPNGLGSCEQCHCSEALGVCPDCTGPHYGTHYETEKESVTHLLFQQGRGRQEVALLCNGCGWRGQDSIVRGGNPLEYNFNCQGCGSQDLHRVVVKD